MSPAKSLDIESYSPLAELALRRLGETNGIKAVEAMQVNGGSYWVLVYVRDQSEPQLLFTTRNHPRVWLSLDRLASYLEKIWPKWPGFSVIVGRRNTAVQRIETMD